MRKQIIFLSVFFLLLTGCNNTVANNKSTVQTTEVSTSDSNGDNIPDNELSQICSVINNLNLSQSNVNSLPFYINLDKGSIGILNYTNNADYKVNITIKGTTDTALYKKIEVPANSSKEVKFSPSNSVKTNESSLYTINMHCSEVNFDGILNLQSALRN